ncbi:site-specific DNA recombinase [Oceanobacillus limi]|uniref:Site-specific DNA recombinase n=1 Tax=Oceanobacillus limi TaxID=930131 RepID=A0A1I0CWF7_9BACI|nr:recombinase family protein [Oceanobacillus limi]SET24177.1 site-specific DNA recombinase [Oceanobacillus limi]
MNEIKKVAIYCRVSTEEQASEGYSIDAQLDTLRQYAKLYGWDVSDEYIDEGISGKSIKGRPAMQRLVSDIEKNKFQAVLVWKISRLSRNMLDTLVLLDKFEEYNVKFISYSENFDTGSPIGRLVLQLMASIAEMERNTLSENVKLGMKQRALQGEWNGGIVFGYDSIEKELIINQKESNVIQLIFDQYAKGKGLKAIANYVNKQGYRTKKDRYFSINGIATILDNPIYNGKISWLKVENWDTKRRKGKNPNPILVEGKHEAIISDELWNIVQTRRKSKSFKQRQSNEPFLLSSILRCPDCGQGMVPSITTYTRKDGTKRKHRYYVCSDFHNKGSSACRANSIKAYNAESTTIEKIQELINNKEEFALKINSLNNNSVNSTKEIQSELKNVDIRIIELKELQDKYFEAYEQNLFPVDILQERLKDVSEEKSTLEQRKNELSTKLSSIDTKVIQPDLLHVLLRKFTETYERSSRNKQKQLLQLLIESISIFQPKDKTRVVDTIELDFDFTEVNISKTFALIHLLYLETDEEGVILPQTTVSNDKLPPYLEQFLPLFMVRFPPNNPKPTINLLQQNQPHNLMWKRHL